MTEVCGRTEADTKGDDSWASDVGKPVEKGGRRIICGRSCPPLLPRSVYS